MKSYDEIDTSELFHGSGSETTSEIFTVSFKSNFELVYFGLHKLIENEIIMIIFNRMLEP